MENTPNFMHFDKIIIVTIPVKLKLSERQQLAKSFFSKMKR